MISITNKIFASLCLLAFVMGCEIANKAEKEIKMRQGQNEDLFLLPPEYELNHTTSDEGITDLELKIFKLNQDIVFIEDKVDINASQELKEAYFLLEHKRMALYFAIDQFNTALAENKEIELSEIRKNISLLIAEAREEVKIIKQIFEINGELK